MSAFLHVHSPLEKNLRAVRSRVDDAATRAGRSPSKIRLLAVTKSVSADVTRAVFEAGCTDLAENRADALAAKAEALAGLGVRWHFIGHLQRNKARRVVVLAHVIHSVDSLRLLETLERLAVEEERSLAIYLQVHATDEPEKHGFAPEDTTELDAAVRAAGASERLELLGLMAMGPRDDGDGSATRAAFARVALLAQRLEQAHPDAFSGGRCGLSMGMSGDLEDAIAAGSTVVRVGSALYRDLESDLESDR